MIIGAPVHFVGISGIGMSALARILYARGVPVTGSSDRRTALTQRLASEGIAVAVGHDAAHLGDARTVVVSSAIDAENVEVAAARRRGIPIVRRGSLLADIVNAGRGIAVAGTHGKTTTTAMLATVLERAQFDPTVALGGEFVATGTNARCGASPWVVCESDESDGSFLALRPEIAVVTNIENDHVASDAEMPALVEAFASFLAELPASGLAVIGTTESRAASLATRPRAARTLTFGVAGADVEASAIVATGFGSEFDVAVRGRSFGRMRLGVPGTINVLDALPAVAIASELGVDTATIAAALADFRGVRRRFEVLVQTPRLVVVDDYAHHPTAVAETIAAARASFSGPIVVALQPHRYTRTKYLAADFARALRAADAVVLTPVYAASEPPIAGVDARSIGEPLRAAGTAVTYVAGVEDVPDAVLALAPHGALALVLGAGSITQAAASLAAAVAAQGAAV